MTARFEAIYWGSDDTPGLYQNETFIGDLNRLKRLCDRLPIAAVTGRPKRDAMLSGAIWRAQPIFSHHHHGGWSSQTKPNASKDSA